MLYIASFSQEAEEKSCWLQGNGTQPSLPGPGLSPSALSALPCSSTFTASPQQSYSVWSSSITAPAALGLKGIKSTTSSTCGPCRADLRFSDTSADHQTSLPWPGLSAPQGFTPVGLGSTDNIRHKHKTSKSSLPVIDNPYPRQRITAADSHL